MLREEILKRQIKDCLKINGKQPIEMPKKSDYVNFKNFGKKAPFMMINLVILLNHAYEKILFAIFLTV